MNNENTQQLHDRLGRLFSESLKVSTSVEMLHLIREKIGGTDYQPFYKQEILDEMGRLQHITRQLNNEMLSIYELLRRAG
ncbi:MAG: hypothetical protein AAF620_18660, partial [Bacteroidota bacterium]